MNILFLAPRMPLPADTGGKIRTLNILKQLAIESSVHLVCFSFEANDTQYIAELQTLGIKVTLVPMADASFLQKINWLLFHGLPISLVKYHTKAMEDSLKQIVRGEKFNAVHVDHLHMAHYLNIFKNIPCMIDEHNVEYKILQRCASVEKSFPKKLAYQAQSRKMNRFEAAMTQQFSCVFTCSTDDRILLNKITNGLVPIYVVPNGVDTGFFQSSDAEPSEDALVFTGSMDWLPNDDAITYFCNEILPLIWKRNPAIKLYVVGKSPSSAVKELAAKDNRVIVTGRVEDVRPYIRRSKIFVVPLRVGGGTRLKILEAMAMGKAIVSTTIGAEGITYTEDENILLADTPEDFADTTVELIADQNKIDSLGKSGRNLVLESYDWAVVGRQLRHFYQKVINEKQ
ncbi:MAG: glycosyltransferase [Candidatus Omnitrophica bacterium]|nr:glycosyltransferase [Candidatus Omnitrophota bacterium]